MKFFLPTEVFIEENAVANHREELKKFGTKALILTGRHSAAENGSLSDVENALDFAGVKHVHFNGIEENPCVETIMKARDLGVAEGVDCVYGIGGGSPMDAAKAVALMIRNSDKPWQFMYDKKAACCFSRNDYRKGNGSLYPGSTAGENAIITALPVIAVPTTCGTGSEVTAISVITRHDLQTKQSLPFKIFPDLALVDGRYLTGAPASVIANTSMDALAHLCESYINSTATPVSRAIADAGLSFWGKTRDNPDDYELRMLASTFGGMAIAHTGTSIPHGLSYTLTYRLHIAHGRACGYFLPGYLGHASREDREHVLSAAGFKDLDELKAYYEMTCGMPTVDEETLQICYDAMIANPARLRIAPYEVDAKVLRDIVFWHS